jgi:hypothetical protein
MWIDGIAVILLLILLGSGAYIWVGFASRRYFREREEHLKRVASIDLNEADFFNGNGDEAA